MHLVDDDDKPVDEVAYPKDKDAVGDGETWGRLPDMTGDFGPSHPTPGAANQAP